jgi:hypothetical protein
MTVAQLVRVLDGFPRQFFFDIGMKHVPPSASLADRQSEPVPANLLPFGRCRSL